MGVKCSDCKHCEFINIDSYDCKARPFVTVSYYGAFVHERECRYYESEVENMSKWSVTNEMIPIEAQMFGDVYCYYQKYYNGDKSVEYIEEMSRAFEEIKQKYNADPFLCGLLIAASMDLTQPERRPTRYGKQLQTTGTQKAL